MDFNIIDGLNDDNLSELYEDIVVEPDSLSFCHCSWCHDRVANGSQAYICWVDGGSNWTYATCYAACQELKKSNGWNCRPNSYYYNDNLASRIYTDYPAGEVCTYK